jgi:hypothetical protein
MVPVDAGRSNSRFQPTLHDATGRDRQHLFRPDLTQVPLCLGPCSKRAPIILRAEAAPLPPLHYHPAHQVLCRASLVPAFIPSMQISSIYLFAHPLLWSFRESC